MKADEQKRADLKFTIESQRLAGFPGKISLRSMKKTKGKQMLNVRILADAKRREIKFEGLPKDYDSLCKIWLPRVIRNRAQYDLVYALFLALEREELSQDQLDYFLMLDCVLEIYERKVIRANWERGVQASKVFFKLDVSDTRLARAIARGKFAHRKLVADEGGSLSADEAAAEIGISRQAILKRYQKGQLIAWRDERRKAVRFPAWQFKARQVLNGIEETLQILNAGDLLDDFGRMLFFLSTHGRLGGKRPLDCLRDGEISKVTQAAQGYVE